MSSISGIGSSLHMAAASLSTHGVGMQVAAHNIANVSTDGFAPQRAVYATGANGHGVALQSVYTPDASFSDSSLPGPSGLGISGTDIAREFTHMISTERGFQANASTIRTADEMTGTLLNIIA